MVLKKKKPIKTKKERTLLYTPTAQILVSKYLSPLNGTRDPWENG